MKKVGDWGEALAAGALEERGYRILARNYRTPAGEIDIVAERDRTTVFVEVKTRRRKGPILPQDAVGFDKQVRLRRMARQFLADHRRRGPCRFDVVAIIAPSADEVHSIQVIENAF